MRTFFSSLVFLFASFPLQASIVRTPLHFSGNYAMSTWAQVFPANVRPYLSGTSDPFDVGSPVPSISLGVTDLFLMDQEGDHIADSASNKDAVSEFARAIPEPSSWVLLLTGVLGMSFLCSNRDFAQE